MLNLDELNKRLSVLVMDCKDNPGKANELMVTEEQYKKIFGEVFTPAKLVNEMLDKLPVEVWNNKDLTWCDPACGSGNFLYHVKRRLMEGLSEVIEDEKERERWIVENMLYGVELQRKNCYLCMFKLDPENEFKTNIACENSLEFNFWGKKFDVVVGNPPYQEQVLNNKTNRPLWDKFVLLAFDKLLKEDGFLCFVHPAMWRKPEHSMWDKLTSKQIVYLSIHPESDGRKTFGAGTRYDWYILLNSPYQYATTVRDETGAISHIDFRNWKFLPNYAFEKLSSMIGESDIIIDSFYNVSTQPYMSRQKGENQYVCVNAINSNGVEFSYSSKNLGHFGTPKVIINIGRHLYPINDYLGEYGMSQNIFGIPIPDKETGEKIINAIKSPGFKKIVAATKWSNFAVDWRMFKFFKKDWYKEFLSEESENE